MAKLPKEAKIIEKVKKEDLPDGLVSVVYFCPADRSKHTYGADYFVEVGPPVACPNDGTPFDQDDQIHRYDDEDDDKTRMKRDDLYRKRGEDVPVLVKPDSPEELKRARARALREEADRLEGLTVDNGIVLGP